jgi:hypothetical protein
MAESKLDS